MGLLSKSRLKRDASGVSGVEYALLVTLVAGASAVAIATLGNINERRMARIGEDVASAPATGVPGGGSGGGSGGGTIGDGGGPGGGGDTGGGTPVDPGPQPGDNFAIALGTTGPLSGTVGESFTFDPTLLLALTDPGTVTQADLVWSIVGGALPDGLLLDAQTGAITGVPQTAGPFTVTIAASFGAHQATTDLSFVIVPPPPQPGPDFSLVLAANTFARQTRDTGFSFDFRPLLTMTDAGTVTIDDIAWSRSAGTLPAGLSLDSLTGTIGGNLTTPGRYTFTLQAGFGAAFADRLYVIEVGGVAIAATQISVGEAHSCAITPAGAILCWGRNERGQLGDGTTTSRTMPVQVSGITSGATAVSAGNSHTCAVVSGAARCWGWNDRGQTGSSLHYVNTLAPTTVITSGVSSVSAGGEHSCAVLTNGTIRCWGYNLSGQLGNGTASGLSSNGHTPVTVSGIASGATQVSAGWHHTCAIVSGSARCWGMNTNGQLGTGNTTSANTPQTVIASGVTSLSAGFNHTCAVASGAARCWGNQQNGRLGNGSTTGNATSPVNVTNLSSGVAAISAGGSHSCARLTSGGARCWGWNSSGRLGDGTTTQRTAPAIVSQSGTITDIHAGGTHSCLRLSTGITRCFGSAAEGQLGNPTETVSSWVPIDVEQ